MAEAAATVTAGAFFHMDTMSAFSFPKNDDKDIGTLLRSRGWCYPSAAWQGSYGISVVAWLRRTKACLLGVVIDLCAVRSDIDQVQKEVERLSLLCWVKGGVRLVLDIESCLIEVVRDGCNVFRADLEVVQGIGEIGT